MVIDIKKNPKKQRTVLSTGDAEFPVHLLTETTIPPYSRKTRSSGAERDNVKTSTPGLQTVSMQLPMSTTVQASKPNAPNKRGGKKKENVNEVQEKMPAVLVGTADVNDDFEGPDNIISPPTEIGPVNSSTVEVTVVDVNTKVNRMLRAIEAMDLMENGDGGDSDEEGFELDFHNDAVRPVLKLYAANSDTVSDNDLDIEFIDNSVGEPWWHMRPPGAKIPGTPDGWSPPGVPENWCGYKPKKNSGAPSKEDIDNPGSWNLYSYTPIQI